jgi:hypothetical protein
MEKEQERRQLQQQQFSIKGQNKPLTLESNGGMYYCLTLEDAAGVGSVGALDTARYGAMTTSTLQMSSTLDQLSGSTARQQTGVIAS